MTSLLAEPDRLERAAAPRRAVRLLALAGTLLLAATLAVFLVRLVATVRIGDCYDAACDGPPTYGVWKVQNGYPLYEPPDREPYCITLYNYGFYHLYARLLSLVGVTGPAIVLGGRLLSVLFGLAGCVLTYRLIMRLAVPGERGGAVRWFVACFAFFLWFGSSSISWFLLSVRPDLASVALATAGLLVYADRRGPATVGRCLLASLVFYLAWAMKQSTVGILAGACVQAALFERRLKTVLALAVPCALLMAATLMLGGADYRMNIIQAPAVTSMGLWSPWAAIPGPMVILQSVATNTFVWLYPVLGAVLYLVTSGRGKTAASVGLSPVAVPALVATAWCFFAAFRDGSDKNTLLEGYVTTGALAAILLLNRLADAGRWAAWVERGLVPLAVLAMTAYPVAQFVFFNRLGNLTIDSPSGHARMVALIEQMRRLPKPILVEDSQLSLPWYTNDGHYPGYTLDTYLMTEARRNGWYKDGGLETLVRRRAFGSLLLKRRGVVHAAVAREAGYRRTPFPPGVDSLGFELYQLPDAAPSSPPDQE